VSLYGDAIRALRQVILRDERVRNTATDLARISQELADLRDRVSRLEGIVAASMARLHEANSTRDRRRLPGPSDQT
jgi:DNA anti-recombination protein RmuC